MGRVGVADQYEDWLKHFREMLREELLRLRDGQQIAPRGDKWATLRQAIREKEEETELAAVKDDLKECRKKLRSQSHV